MTVEHMPVLPLSHPIRVETIRQRGTEVTVSAEPQQFAAIAAMLGLTSLEFLEARYQLSRNGDRVKLEGRIAARLHQTCIVTLDPFPVQLDVPVKLDFAPETEDEAASRRAERDKAEIDIEVLLLQCADEGAHFFLVLMDDEDAGLQTNRPMKGRPSE